MDKGVVYKGCLRWHCMFTCKLRVRKLYTQEAMRYACARDGRESQVMCSYGENREW